MQNTPSDLASQARQIARSGMPARAAWGELKSWASDKGPMALRSAAMEFISVYGRNPEAALLMPEVMRSSSGFMPFPTRQSTFDFRLQAKPEIRKAAPGLNFEPKYTAKAPLEKIQVKTALEMPKRPIAAEPSEWPEMKAYSASKGHSIVHSLIDKMRSHAADHVPRHLSEAPARKAKSVKSKRKAAKKTRKPVKVTKKKPIKKTRPSKKPVKKSRRR